MKNEIKWYQETLGTEIIFKDFRIDEYNRMIASWKIEGLHENKHDDEGFFFNAKYLAKNKAFETYGFKYKGKSVRGFKIPAEFDIEGIEEEVRILHEAAKQSEKERLEEEYSEGKEISFHRSYNGFYLGEEYLKTNQGKELNKILEDEKIERKVMKQLEDYVSEEDWGEYSITTYYKINNLKFKEIVLKVLAEVKEEREEKRLEKEKKEEEIFDKARETGEKQILVSWSEPCKDSNEECNIDNVVIWAMPNGEKKIIRNHTW